MNRTLAFIPVLMLAHCVVTLGQTQIVQSPNPAAGQGVVERQLQAADLPKPEKAEILFSDSKEPADANFVTGILLSNGDSEAFLRAHGTVTQVVFAYFRPATAAGIVDQYVQFLQRLNATILYRCERAQCGPADFRHWPPRVSPYGDGRNTQVYLTARIPGKPNDQYLSLHTIESVKYALSRPGSGKEAGLAFVEAVSGNIVAEKKPQGVQFNHFPGSTVMSRNIRELDEVHVLFGPIKSQPRNLSGRITETEVSVPSNRRLLEVFSNYETAAKSAGFVPQFSCHGNECGEFFVIHYCFPPKDGITPPLYGGPPDAGPRYLVGARDRGTGKDYFYFCGSQLEGSGVRMKIVTVESMGMSSGLVEMRADQILSDIAKQGRAALYGIYSATDKAVVKPESQPALDEMAKALRQQTDLRLVIVGHTDNAGGLDYNLDLSNRRAEAVRLELV